MKRYQLECFRCARVYVLPSRYETFPVSVLKAVACRTLVILTENRQISEIIKDNVRLVVKSSPNELGEALLKMLQDEELRDIFQNKL